MTEFVFVTVSVISCPFSLSFQSRPVPVAGAMTIHLTVSLSAWPRVRSPWLCLCITMPVSGSVLMCVSVFVTMSVFVSVIGLVFMAMSVSVIDSEAVLVAMPVPVAVPVSMSVPEFMFRYRVRVRIEQIKIGWFLHWCSQCA